MKFFRNLSLIALLLSGVSIFGAYCTINFQHDKLLEEVAEKPKVFNLKEIEKLNIEIPYYAIEIVDRIDVQAPVIRCYELPLVDFGLYYSKDAKECELNIRDKDHKKSEFLLPHILNCVNEARITLEVPENYHLNLIAHKFTKIYDQTIKAQIVVSRNGGK